jgi:hypothetical protein
LSCGGQESKLCMLARLSTTSLDFGVLAMFARFWSHVQ